MLLFNNSKVYYPLANEVDKWNISVVICGTDIP